jgi:hypothetical protein
LPAAAAVVVQVVPEARLPVPAEALVPARLPAQEQELPALAPPVLPQVRAPAQRQVVGRLVRLPVLEHRAVEAAVLLRPLSLRWFSAAMAGSTP